VAQAAQMAAVFRDELEKRVGELTEVIAERNALAQVRRALLVSSRFSSLSPECRAAVAPARPLSTPPLTRSLLLHPHQRLAEAEKDLQKRAAHEGKAGSKAQRRADELAAANKELEVRRRALPRLYRGPLPHLAPSPSLLSLDHMMPSPATFFLWPSPALSSTFYL